MLFLLQQTKKHYLKQTRIEGVKESFKVKGKPVSPIKAKSPEN